MRPPGAALAARASNARPPPPTAPPILASVRHPARAFHHTDARPAPRTGAVSGNASARTSSAASQAASQSSLSSAVSPPPSQAPTCLKSLTLDGLTAWAAALGDPNPPARALQLWRLLYYRDTRSGVGLVGDLATEAGPGVQGGLGAAFLERVAGTATVHPGIELEAVHSSSDGTRKLVFLVTQGPASGRRVDAVLIPVVRAGGRPRLTLCVSSQAGCAQACSFCLTGAMGLGGSLSAGQIVEQAVVAQRILAAEAEGWEGEGEDAGGAPASGGEASQPPGETPRPALPPPPLPPAPRLTNVVFMGQGEPLDNYASVSAAVSILTHPLGEFFFFFFSPSFPFFALDL